MKDYVENVKNEETRDKLVQIMQDIHQECLSEGTYCCYCDYNKYDNRICWKYWMADAIIESGLLKDEKVYQYVNGNYCSKCNHFLSFKGYNYCPTCGAKLKE